MTIRSVAVRSAPIAGSPHRWAGDLALVGAVTGLLAPALVIFDPGYSFAAAVAGGGSGAVLGTALPRGLELARRWLPLSVLFALAPVVGAVWGGGTGAFAGLFAASPFADGSGVGLGLVFGGIAGMVQLGAMWFPYTVQAVRGGMRGPVVALACLAAPVLGWAAVAVFLCAPLLLAAGVLAAPALAVAVWQLEASVARARLPVVRARRSLPA